MLAKILNGIHYPLRIQKKGEETRMAFLIAGRIFGLLLLAVIMAAVAYYIKGAEKGRIPNSEG